MEKLTVEDVLIRALCDGATALPDDLERLREFLALIARLLAEKASEHEPTWEMVAATAAEIETLQQLEESAAEKAVAVPAPDLAGALTKLAIWSALDDTGDDCIRDRLVESVRRDLEHIAHGDRTCAGGLAPARVTRP